MDIDVLGALAVREGGVPVTPTAPKQRQMLALLALNADHAVPVTDLVEELWEGRPPRSARTTLQTYVLHLRDHIARALALAAEQPGERDRLPRGAKDVLVTLPGAYLLAADGGSSDVRRFETLAGEGYRAMDAASYADASARLTEALNLWTGPAFADVQQGTLLAREAKRLEESRLCALDQRIEADLHLGRHRELLAELIVLTSRYRTHENLHAQFMVALARSGRRSESMHVYRQLRTTLVRELGLEPSPRLQRLQHSIQASAVEVPEEPVLAVG
ncbi:AfsR/SARP family transcriptional regulator [Streptomyces sp. HUAS TT20]|uniref:AfsR/SARP family transcriptional regulator n=1 Tax=Streptomyces sp. HUAS TT20 TaxID=3447509 RepID=UPI0021DA8564|nr:AfsR/SARP family transcriptional regulator [Streptomyces sp. HUAS 15-9]UXY33092.1 AfsR/SARP family transcriptional regulator [Streptomyces sp. HUAS 15-9]